MDDDYIENFLKAEATFKHMYIYNPLQRRMERLCALEDYDTEERYCSNAGTLLEDSDQALHLALGNLNPFSLKRLDSWTPEKAAPPAPKNVKRAQHKSIWEGNFQRENRPTEKKEASCALFFKKVDFVSKTVDEEIETNQRLEEAKKTEAQVFTMYSFKAKRRRSPNREGSLDRESTPPPSPIQTRSRHNPFAKERSAQDPIQRSPVVCENASLLRLLSPKKASPLGQGADEKRVNSLKRSIFAKESVEVRSRFFSSQAEQQTRSPKEQPSQEEEDKDEEQKLSSSSSHKKLRLERKDTQERQRSNSPESEAGTETESQDKPALASTSEEPANSLMETPKADTKAEPKIRIKTLDLLVDPADSDSNNNEAIILLSDDSCSSELNPSSSQEAASSTHSSIILQRQNSLPMGRRRVGLSKPPSTASKKGTPKTKTNGKLGAVSDNQTKLSMFGFQKRPVLK